MFNIEQGVTTKSFRPQFLLYSGFISSLIGAMVLFGWLIHSEALIQLHRSFVPMQFNTALGFVLSGFLWISVYKKKSPLVLMLALFLLALGVLTLVQYLFSVDLGIDQLLMEHYITTKTSHPGRMAPNTALCFILSALSGFISFRLTHYKTSIWEHLLPIVLLITFSGVPLLGYLLNLESAYGWQTYTRMAVHTSIGFLILGVGGLLNLTGKIERSRFAFLLPASIIGLVFLLLVSAMRRHENISFKSKVEHEALAVRYTLLAELNQVKSSLQRMAERLSIDSVRLNEHLWRSDANSYLRDFGFIVELNWLNRSGKTQFSYPDLPEKTRNIYDLNGLLTKMVPENSAVVHGQVFDMISGRSGINLLFPSYQEGKLQGYLLALLNIAHFTEQYLNKNQDLGFHISIFHKKKLISGNSIDQVDLNSYLNQHRITLSFEELGDNLEIEFIPPVSMELNSRIPEIVLLLGFLLSIVCAVAFQLFLNHRTLLQQARQQRDDLAVVNLEIENSLEKKSLFFANMNHELRTPLNGIIGISELVLEEKTNVSREYLLKQFTLVSQIGDRLLRIINDILDFSKLESGKMEIEELVFRPQSIVESMEQLFLLAVRKKGIDFSTEISNEVSTYIKSDPDRISQILVNLIGNAIKFTDRGQVKLSVFVSGKNSEDLKINFSVQDTGIGLSSEQLSKLFQPFAQSEKSIARLYGGTGLGLFICKNLAELLGGVIFAESEPGNGSKFVLTIPCKKAEENFTSEDNNEISQADTFGNDAIKILVVDDNEINASIVCKHLEKLGFSPHFCYSGFETLKKFEVESFDLVFLDCHMPGMDGFEVTKALIQKLGSSRPYICALTASTMKEDQSRCFDCGMDSYLSKPVKRAMLEKEIQSALVSIQNKAQKNRGNLFKQA